MDRIEENRLIIERRIGKALLSIERELDYDCLYGKGAWEHFNSGYLIVWEEYNVDL